MAKIVITNGTIHSDDDFNLTSGSDANTRNNFRICKQKDSHTRLRSLSSFRLKTHDFLNTGNAEICGNLTVHGTCTVLNTTLCLTDTTATDNFTLVSTDAGASAAPDLKLYRNSASPANNDSLGHIKFSGKDAAGNETEYASLKGCIQSVTSGGECGTMLGTVVINGSSCDIFRVDYAGIWTVNSKNLYISGNGQLRNYGQCLRLSTGGGAYDIQFEPNSVLKARLNPDGILFVCGKVDTPILKASSCTHYGACTSSKLTSDGDMMKHTTAHGFISLGPANSTWAHINTDRNCFYIHKPIAVDGGHVKSYDEDLALSRAGNAVNRIIIGSATTTSCQPFTIKDSVDNTYETGLNIIRSANADSVWINQKGGATNFNNKNNAGNAGQDYRFFHNGTESVRICASNGRLSSNCGIYSNVWIYATNYFQGCRLYTRTQSECFHFCTGNMACNAWMTAGRLYPGGSWQLNSRQGYTIPNTGNATCWLKFGAMCIPQHGYKMLMKVVASNGYGSSTTDTTQETTLLFQTSNTGEACSGSSVCACVHSFIEGSTKSESDAPYCFIVHQVNSSFYEFFGKFNTYTGAGSYYTVDHGPSSGWIACNSFVDPDSCSGSCIVSIPNRGTIFCTSASTTCICGTAIPQGDICMNNGSRGYKLGTDTAGSGSRAFLVLDNDGTDGIGSGSDYTLIVKNGTDTQLYNQGPEHIRLCSSSCVAFCKPLATNCIRNHGANPYLNQYSGCCLIGGVHFRDCEGCTRGYVYHDGTSNFGLLSCAGSWALQIIGTGSLRSAYTHNFCGNIGLCGGSASRVCIGGNRAMEGTSGILSLGEDFTSICLRAGCTYSNAPMYIGGKVSVGTATCPPEMFGVCGNGMRIAHSAGNPVLYFGASYSSVDIGLQRAGADQLDFKYYDSGWCNAFCLNKGCTKSCICHESPVLCATGCVKTPLIQAQGGKSCFSAPAAAADDWACSALHIRERGEVSSAQSHDCYAPNLNFHWGGRVSNSLWMNATGQLNWGSYNGNGCPDTNGNCRFNTGIVYGETCLISNILAGGGSAASDYGAIQITGAKGGYGGFHSCGYTFMAASDCGGGGIYNDTHNQWVIWNGANAATYIYHAGSAKLHTLENGVRACKSGCGYIDLCPSGSWGHIITDRNNFYFNQSVAVNSGCIGSYDEDLILHRGHANSTAGERITITSGTTHICQLTKVHGNLCVTGQVCADGMQGDEYTTVSVRTTVSCFHPGCVVGRDNVYDIFVSANPNCDGGDYRDIHHIQAYVSTGYSGSAVTTYINSRQVMGVGGYGGSCGATPSTQASVHLVNGSGAHAYEYPGSCTLCLGIQLCGGQSGGSNCCRRAVECVLVKKIL